MAKKIRIAIQQKGRLREASIEYLASCGLEFSVSNTRSLIASCLNEPVELIFVRNSDIPKYVAFGVADFGIVGENVLYEQDADLPVVGKLDFGRCALVIAAPVDGSINALNDLNHERIATKYPNSLKKFLSSHNVDASIVELKGSVEIAPSLGLADAICDITQTGGTLKEHDLIVIEKILDSQAVLIESPFEKEVKASFKSRVLRKDI